MRLNGVIIIGIATLLFNQNLKAQNFNVPKDYSFKDREDFKPYENDVIKCVDWLETTPLDWAKEKHANAYKFLTAWIDGAPNVKVEVSSNMVSPGKNRDAEWLVYYMGGWARYELTHTDKPDKVQACLAGLRLMMNAYKRGKELNAKPDKKIEQLLAIDKNGGLEKWATEEMAKHKRKGDL